MKVSSNFIGDSNDKNNFPHKLLLTVLKLCKAFAKGSSANLKLLTTWMYKVGQSGGRLGIDLKPLLKTGLPLLWNVLKPLAKSALISLGLIAAVSVKDAAIHKKCLDQVLLQWQSQMKK